MKYGLVSSKQGHEASLNTDDNYMTIKSNYLTFSIYKQDTITMTVDDNGGNSYGKYYRKSISHDLGYPGQIMAFHKVPSSFNMTSETNKWFCTPFTNSDILGGGFIADTDYTMSCNVNDNEVRFSFVSNFSSLASTDMDVSYFLFSDSLTNIDYQKIAKSGYGIKVSKIGDVKNVTAKDLSFSSVWPILQIEESSDPIDIPESTYGDWSIKTISHDLGYSPAFLGYHRYKFEGEWGDWYPQPTYSHSQAPPAAEIGYKIGVDKNNVYIYYRNAVDGGGATEFEVQVMYVIFTNKIGE